VYRLGQFAHEPAHPFDEVGRRPVFGDAVDDGAADDDGLGMLGDLTGLLGG